MFQSLIKYEASVNKMMYAISEVFRVAKLVGHMDAGCEIVINEVESESESVGFTKDYPRRVVTLETKLYDIGHGYMVDGNLAVIPHSYFSLRDKRIDSIFISKMSCRMQNSYKCGVNDFKVWGPGLRRVTPDTSMQEKYGIIPSDHIVPVFDVADLEREALEFRDSAALRSRVVQQAVDTARFRVGGEGFYEARDDFNALSCSHQHDPRLVSFYVVHQETIAKHGDASNRL